MKTMSSEMADLHFGLWILLTALLVIALHPAQNLIPSCPDTIMNNGIPMIAKKTVKTLAPGVDGATFP